MCITVLIVFTCKLIIAKCASILTKHKVYTCNKKRASLMRQEYTCAGPFVYRDEKRKCLTSSCAPPIVPCLNPYLCRKLRQIWPHSMRKPVLVLRMLWTTAECCCSRSRAPRGLNVTNAIALASILRLFNYISTRPAPLGNLHGE